MDMRSIIFYSILMPAFISCSNLTDFQYEDITTGTIQTDLTDTISPVPGNSGSLSFVVFNISSITVTWTAGTDNISPQSSLQYQVYYSLSNNINTVSNTLANGTAFGTATANITNQTVTGLLQNTPYYFSILVKDQNNMVNCYNSSNFQINASAPVPGAAGSLSLGLVTSNSIAINWTKAADDYTPQANLQYLVYYSTANNINSIANTLVNGTAVGSYATDISNKTITGLNDNTVYYMNVLVVDSDQYTNCYASSSFMITNLAPVPGSSGTITLGTVTSNSIAIRWSKATDDYTAQAGLQYLVYYSTLNNINTVANALANGTPVGSFTANITNKTVTGLTGNINYYMNILVIDGNNYTNGYASSPFMITNLAPVPGSSGAISIGTVTTNSIQLNWSKATDDYTAQTGLQYLVYYSSADNITNLTSTLANGTPFGTYSADINTKTITGLTIDSTYYFNILVIDSSGYTNSYTSIEQKTLVNLTSYEAFFKLNNLLDSSPNGHDLYNYGASQTLNRNGTVNSAYDTTSQGLDVYTLTELNFTTEMTLSVWIKSTDVSLNQKIISKTSINNGYNLAIIGGHVYVEIWDSLGNFYTYTDGTQTITSGVWTHIAMTWKTGGKLRSYVNGVLDKEINAGPNPIGADTGNYFSIGFAAWDGVSFRFKGAIDDIRVYGIELNQTEVINLANLAAD